MPGKSHAVISFLFFFHIGVTFYVGIGAEDCAGKSSEIFAFVIMSFVFGWTALLLASAALPDKYACVICSAIPIAGLAAWGMRIMAVSVTSEAHCVVVRTLVVTLLCAIQISELFFFSMHFIFRAVAQLREEALGQVQPFSEGILV